MFLTRNQPLGRQTGYRGTSQAAGPLRPAPGPSDAQSSNAGTSLRSTGRRAPRREPALAPVATVGWLSLCFGLSACQPDLPRISLVSEMDILGHRVEVEGEPARATPKPGESGTIRWQVIYPEVADDNDEDLSLLALECTMPQRYIGRPICEEFLNGELMDALEDLMSQAEEAPLGEQGMLGFRCTEDLSLPLGPLTLHCLRGHTDADFTVPKGYERSERLFTGIVCRHGVAELSDHGFSCAEAVDGADIEAEEFLSSVPVQTGADARNQNPDIDAFTLKFNSERWLPWNGKRLPQAQDCNAPSARLPTLADGEEVTLDLAYAASDRERVNGKNEQMRISHRATAGEFDTSASYLARDLKPNSDGDLVTDALWTAPSKEEKGERVIRFYFGLRDGRGGFATTERFACQP